MSAMFPLSEVAAEWRLSEQMKEPERWIATQLKKRRFRGRKFGRVWMMSTADIAHAEQVVASSPTEVPVSLESRRGPSAASLRRRAS